MRFVGECIFCGLVWAAFFMVVYAPFGLIAFLLDGTLESAIALSSIGAIMGMCVGVGQPVIQRYSQERRTEFVSAERLPRRFSLGRMFLFLLACCAFLGTIGNIAFAQRHDEFWIHPFVPFTWLSSWCFLAFVYKKWTLGPLLWFHCSIPLFAVGISGVSLLLEPDWPMARMIEFVVTGLGFATVLSFPLFVIFLTVPERFRKYPSEFISNTTSL